MSLAAGAAAMALGPARGLVQLGAPLDLVFDLELEPRTHLGDACLSARLMYGEETLSLSKTRLTPLPASGASAVPQVRVQGPNVHEPVVRVTLSAGCTSKISRQYTFLTELPQPAALSALPTDLPRVADALSARPAARKAAVVVSPIPGDAVLATDMAARPAPRPPRKPLAEPGTVRSRPRLQMEPLESWFAAPTALRSSWSLSAAPSEESNPRRLEAAALWKQLNQGPQDLQRAFDRAGALETEAATLRTQAQQARAQAQEVQARLEVVERERYPAEWVYGLGATSLAFLGLAALGWRRARQRREVAAPAWHEAGDAPPSPAEPAPSDAHAGGLGSPLSLPAMDHSPPPASAAAAVPVPAAGALGPDLDTPDTPPWPLPAAASGAPAATANPFAPAGGVPGHAAPSAPVLSAVQEAELLFDVRQQAEFFVSVGEHDQAIQLLKEHLASHADRSPVAYLDLLQLYHTLGRAEDFRQLRVEFMRHFNAQVPDFSGFNLPSRNLESYPAILEEIDQAWPSEAVRPLLEAQIFRSSDRLSGGHRYELEAFDDLQLLLGIVQNTTPAERASNLPRQASSVPDAAASPAAGAPVAPASPSSAAWAPAPAPAMDLPFALHLPGAAAAPSSSWRDAPSQVATPLAPAAPQAVEPPAPMEAVLLPPEEFLLDAPPFVAPPRQVPEPSQPTELSELLRQGGDVDFDDPLLHGFLVPANPPAATTPEAAPEAPALEDTDLSAHRYVGKALDFEPTEQSFNIKK